MYHYFSEYKKNAKYLAYILLLMALLADISYASNQNGSAGTSQYRTANGYIIYMGVLPAEMILGDVDMHGGVPVGAFRYHVTVAIFNSETGKRITTAKVSTRISNSSSDTGFEKLDSMEFNKMHVYGNYFKLSSPGPYRIQVLVEDKNSAEKVTVDFQYLQAHVHINKKNY